MEGKQRSDIPDAQKKIWRESRKNRYREETWFRFPHFSSLCPTQVKASFHQVNLSQIWLRQLKCWQSKIVKGWRSGASCKFWCWRGPGRKLRREAWQFCSIWGNQGTSTMTGVASRDLRLSVAWFFRRHQKSFFVVKLSQFLGTITNLVIVLKIQSQTNKLECTCQVCKFSNSG